ncbi:hypothetical protein HNQ50_001434 [Silvimonas terrae]|uniref:Uncharacterized protein n=1 Tax=Silvimonas terrae TaxID=300266 RepID=A0A840REH9_9NEIS|nr:hypothetical protein [Silvimonas terrae]MBB5190712.1 hypothetical protein [Silvimonas terrae]
MQQKQKQNPRAPHIHPATLAKLRREKNFAFNLAVRRGRVASAAYQKRWKTESVTALDIDYWLHFVVNHYFLSVERREAFIRTSGVIEKIQRCKHEGNWPPPVMYNQQFFEMFCRAYNWRG